MTDRPESWSGRIGFILATIGSAVGLGSIWKFPYEVGANGGGAFVVFYILGLLLVVTPLIFAEFAIGRRGRADATRAIAAIAMGHGASPRWAWIGTWGVAASFLILSFYSVIGGWAIAYGVDSAWAGLGPANAAAMTDRFAALLAAPVRMAAFHAAFMILTAAIVARGIAGGIERAATVLMPVMISLIAALAIYALAEGGAEATLRFLFVPDFASFTPRAALEAVGLGFFSIGVGLALMATYAAYAGPAIDLRQAAVITLAGDTAISFLAGFAVFPVVFAHGLDPASGPGLMFVTMPLAFADLPGGRVAAAAFFVLLALAALASAISLLEMPSAYLQRRLGWGRPRATVAAAAACWLLGLASVLSFNLWSDWHPLAALPSFATATVFDLLDHLTSNLMLPAGGFAIAIFAGWVLPPTAFRDELRLGPRAAAILAWMLRVIVPAGILAATLGPLLAA